MTATGYPHAAVGSWLRPAAVVAVIVLAYHQSFRTLVDGLQLDTPIAHLGLVPLIALGLAAACRSRPAGPAIHDRQVDVLVGAPLLAIALSVNFLLPARLSTDFWTWRVDLLTLPLFAAGAVVLILGTRALWRALPAILFLVLAWPWPYTFVLDRWLGRFTSLTISALRGLLELMPLATPSGGAGSSLFSVGEGPSRVELSVASACSGANGLVGFLLVGAALTLAVRGSRRRKLAWLATGACVVWVLNLARILLIFAAAAAWGGDAAIDGLHPYVGLVVFNVGLVVMLAFVKPFGLTFERASPEGRRERVAYRPRLGIAVSACLLVVTLALAVLNMDLRDRDAIATSLGTPRLVGFAESLERPSGWTVTRVTTYDWTKRFFGETSEWTRYNYLSDGTGELASNLPVIADVIETPSRAALAAYGIEACYRFHDFDISNERSVSLGSGVVGRAITYSKKSGERWTALYWHWPIGGEKRYERTVLLVPDHATASFTAPAARDAFNDPRLVIEDRLRGASTGATGARQRSTQEFLAQFARSLVAQRRELSG